MFEGWEYRVREIGGIDGNRIGDEDRAIRVKRIKFGNIYGGEDNFSVDL